MMNNIPYSIRAPHFLKLRMDIPSLTLPDDPDLPVEHPAPWVFRSGPWLIQRLDSHEYLFSLTGRSAPLRIQCAPCSFSVQGKSFHSVTSMTLTQEGISLQDAVQAPAAPAACDDPTLCSRMTTAASQLAAARACASLNASSVTARNVEPLLLKAEEFLHKAFAILSRQIGAIEASEQAILSAILVGNGTVDCSMEVPQHGQ